MQEFKNKKNNEVCISKGVGLNCPAKTSYTGIIFENIIKVKKKNHFFHIIEGVVINNGMKIGFNSQHILKHFQSKNTKEFRHRRNLLSTVIYNLDKVIFDNQLYGHFIFKNFIIKVVLGKQSNGNYFVKTFYINDKLSRQYKQYLDNKN